MIKYLCLLLIATNLVFGQNKSFDTVKVRAVQFKGNGSVQTTAGGGGTAIVTGNTITDSLNNANRIINKNWTFSADATFATTYLSGVESKILWTDVRGKIVGLGIPETFAILGGDGAMPYFYKLVGAGGASVTVSSDTVYITASGGGSPGTITAIQSSDNSIDVINPTGATTTVNVKALGIDSTKLASNSITSGKIANGSINTVDVASSFKAPDALKADTSTYSRATASHVQDASTITSGIFNPNTGGTGRSTFPYHSIILGNLTSPMEYLNIGNPYNVVRVNNISTAITYSLLDSNSMFLEGVAGWNIAQNAITSGNILNGSLLNVDIATTAAIAYSKLATMNTGQILVGNAGVPTATTISGDFTISATGVATINNIITSAKIVDGTIVRADVISTFKAPYSDTADYAKASLPSGPAGGDFTSTYPNPLIAAGKVGRSKIDPTILIGVNGLTGMIPVWYGADTIGHNNIPASMLLRSSVAHFADSIEAHDASKLYGTISKSRYWNNNFAGGTFTNMNATVDANTGLILWAENGVAGSGGGSANIINGQDAFGASATTDTLIIAGCKSYYTATAIKTSTARTTAPVTNDILSTFPTRDTVYVNRASAAAGAASYQYQIVPDSLSPPTGFDATPYLTDSIALTWTLPVNNSSSTSATVDSIITTFTDTGYISSPDLITGAKTVNHGKKYLPPTATKDTLFELSNSTKYYCQVWDRTWDDFNSSAGAWSRDTATTGSGAVAFNPKAYSVPLAAWYDVQQYSVTGYENLDSVSYLPDYSDSNHFLTSKNKFKPIAYSSGGW